jgi:hypothetical protein
MRAYCIHILVVVIIVFGCGKKSNPTGPGGNLVVTQGKIIDHTCANLSAIPARWIDSVQAKCKLHYAHTSHGGQLTTGLDTIQGTDSTYQYAIRFDSLPAQQGAFCILDGQISQTYIIPELYWQTAAGMNLTRNVLTNNPSIKYSMWAWCTQLDGYDSAQVQQYLDSMTVLEGEFLSVTFIYMTGNAQATDAGGWNRHCRNQQIRRYCTANKKVLFDFADLDAWYNGTQETDTFNGNTFPVEHAHYHGDEAAHTTHQSCMNKGRAFWWMMARLAGWDGN